MIRGVVNFSSKVHKTDDFDCGDESLNQYIKTIATQAQKAGTAQIHVYCDPFGHVLGYVALTIGSVAQEEGPDGMSRRGMSRHLPIPIVLLARLAVHKSMQREGIGSSLMALTYAYTVDIADRAGVKLLVVDALSEDAATYYETQHGFTRWTDESNRLYMTVADVRATLAAAAHSDHDAP